MSVESTDMYGDEAEQEVVRFMDELQTRTDCKYVTCNSAAVGRVLYYAKRDTVGPAVFRVAAKHGFRVTLAGVRAGYIEDEETNGYVEFLPIEVRR